MWAMTAMSGTALLVLKIPAVLLFFVWNLMPVDDLAERLSCEPETSAGSNSTGYRGSDARHTSATWLNWAWGGYCGCSGVSAVCAWSLRNPGLWGKRWDTHISTQTRVSLEETGWWMYCRTACAHSHPESTLWWHSHWARTDPFHRLWEKGHNSLILLVEGRSQ